MHVDKLAKELLKRLSDVDQNPYCSTSLLNCHQLNLFFIFTTGLADIQLKLEIDDQLLNHVLEAGFDPVYGARPLKRAIQQLIENPLAEDILSGKFGPGVTIKGTLDKDIAVFFGD